MAVFLYLAFKNTDFNIVADILKNISFGWYILFLFVWFLSHLFRAYRWKIIIDSVKSNISLLNLFGATMVGYGVNCVVPRLGELYRGFFLGKWEDISRTSMVGTVVIERVIDLLVLGISILISISIYSGNLYSEISWLRSTMYLGFLIIFGLIVFLFLLVKFQEHFYNAILKFVGKFSHKIANALGRTFTLLIDGFTSIKGVGKYTYIIFLSFVIMLLYGATSYIMFFVLGMQKVQPVNYSMAWIVMTISAFGVIIPTPGATGTYHFFVIFILTKLFNFSNEISSAFAILTHTTTYVLFIFSTLFLTFIINKIQEKKNKPVAKFLTVFRTKTESL